MYLTHARFIEYGEHCRRYGLNRLSSTEIEATWGMQLEDPKVPKDVVEGQPRIRVGVWTDLFDSDQAIHKVFKKVRNLGPPIGLAAEGNQALSQDEDEGTLKRRASAIFDAVDGMSGAGGYFMHFSRTEGGARSSK